MREYPSDLTGKQWELIAPLIPPPKHGGRPRKADERLIVDALLYISRTGCQWRYLPEKYPPKSTAYHYFKMWREDNTWDNIVTVLREKAKEAAGRNSFPSAIIIDSQSVKTTGRGTEIGFDGGKKIKGRKRHIAVDVLGFLICVIIHSAGQSDRSGAKPLIQKILSICSTIQIFWADEGYSGKPLFNWVKNNFQKVLEIVKRPTKGFKVVQWRWIVERTFGWFK